MDAKRRDYLHTIVNDLHYYIRTMNGFAPHPTYFDKDIIKYLDSVVKGKKETIKDD